MLSLSVCVCLFVVVCQDVNQGGTNLACTDLLPVINPDGTPKIRPPCPTLLGF